MPDLSWMDRAACRGQDTELFFPNTAAEAAPARWWCRRCPVVSACRDYARQRPDLDGIWGDTSKRQRTIARNRARARGAS